jgi:hypothetical protein
MRMPFDAAPGPVISEAGIYDANVMLHSSPPKLVSDGQGDTVVEKNEPGALEAPLGDISISGNVSMFDGMIDDEEWFDTLLNWVDAPDGQSGNNGHNKGS